MFPNDFLQLVTERTTEILVRCQNCTVKLEFDDSLRLAHRLKYGSRIRTAKTQHSILQRRMRSPRVRCPSDAREQALLHFGDCHLDMFTSSKLSARYLHLLLILAAFCSDAALLFLSSNKRCNEGAKFSIEVL